jgi:hypothetical protein
MVAGGQGTNTLAYSFNGNTWIPVTSSPFSTAGRGVAWNGSLWVAVGEGGNTLAISPNGITWSGTTSPFTTSGQAVAWNGSLWVAVGDNNMIYSSTDGVLWSPRGTTGGTLSFTTNGRGIAWNGSLWVAVGQGTNSIATSPTGILWTGLGTSVFSTAGLGIAWNGSLWVAVGEGASHTIATSPDGITWSGLGKTTFSTAGYGVAWNGSLWVAVGQGTNTVATSSNGTTWFPVTVNPPFSSAGIAIAWNGSLWVAGGQGTNTLATSSNGSNWNAVTSSPFSTAGRGVASRRVLPYVGSSLLSGNSSAPVRATFGIRFPYSNVSSGTSLTVSRNTYGTVYNITTAALTNLTLDFNGAVWSADSNAYWTLRNNTQTYLSLVTASANTSTLGVTVVVPTPITIPPTNSTIVMLDNLSNIVLF